MTGGSFTCPLCGLADDRLEGIYRHLLSAHRKSSLANALLDSTPPDEAPDPTAGRAGTRRPIPNVD